MVDEGHADLADPWDSDGDTAPTPLADIIDGIPHDGCAPNAHLESLQIGLKGDQTVTEAGVTD